MTDANGHGGSALPLPVDEMKRHARASGMLARAGVDPAAGVALAGAVLGSGLVPAGACVAGYWPMQDEMDVRPLMAALHAAGHALALPRTPPRGSPLRFHAWAPGGALERGPFGTRQPGDGSPIRPDVLLVPLLAFDARCRRLGYGGGYYDRTLAGLPGAVSIGCAFAAQEVPEVPCGPHDVTLRAVATERGIIIA